MEVEVAFVLVVLFIERTGRLARCLYICCCCCCVVIVGAYVFVVAVVVVVVVYIVVLKRPTFIGVYNQNLAVGSTWH